MTTKKSGSGAPKGVLYLGIDLGTSRCAVVGSNGVRDAVAYCDMLREHNVAAAHFNDGASSASIPLARIVEMAGG